MEKIRILRTITWMPIGGIEKSLLQVVPILNKEPFEVRVCCLREKGALVNKLEKSGVGVDFIPFRKRLDPIAIAKFIRYLKANKFHILHSHMYRSNVPSTIAGRIAKVPIIISQIHNVNTWETRRQLLMDKFLCRFRDGIIAVSEEVKRDIVENLKVPSDFVKVIYNGVENERFESVKKDHKFLDSFLNSLGIEDDEIVIVMVSRLVEQKNPSFALRVFRKVLNKCPKSHLIFVGEGKLREELENDSQNIGISRNVHFLGMREDIPEILKASDIFLLPSLREGFSNAILEAMAAGLPVIVSDVGGNKEAVRDGVDGFLVNPEDEEMVKQKILLLIEDAAKRKEMGDNARNYVRRFSIDEMVKNLKEYYLSLLKKKNIPV